MKSDGLQIRVHRFDSGTRLQAFQRVMVISRLTKLGLVAFLVAFEWFPTKLKSRLKTYTLPRILHHSLLSIHSPSSLLGATSAGLKSYRSQYFVEKPKIHVRISMPVVGKPFA